IAEQTGFQVASRVAEDMFDRPSPLPGRHLARRGLAPAPCDNPRRSQGPGKPAMHNVTVVTHPLVQHKLTLMRRRETATSKLREARREGSRRLGYSVTRDRPPRLETMQTPLHEMESPVIAGKKVVCFSILRAGSGLLDGMLDLVPSARVGHVGLYRDP